MGASWKRKFAWGEGSFAWGLLGVGLSLLGVASKFDQSNCSVHHYIISQFSNISDFWFQKRDSSGQIPWGLLGVCLGCDEPMLGDVRFTMFAWGFDTSFAWG